MDYFLQYLEKETDIFTIAAAAASLQSCLTLCDPTDGSPPGSPVPGILQARTLEWVAISFSNAWKWKGKVKHSKNKNPHPNVKIEHKEILSEPNTTK